MSFELSPYRKNGKRWAVKEVADHPRSCLHGDRAPIRMASELMSHVGEMDRFALSQRDPKQARRAESKVSFPR